MRFEKIRQKLWRLLPWLGLAIVLAINLALLLRTAELHDFGSFVASGLAARAGQDPFGVYPLTARGEFQGVAYAYPNLNPPIWLPAFEMISHLEPEAARAVWVALSLLLYAAGVWLVARRQPVPALWLAWAFSLAGLWNNLLLGQVYAVPFLLGAGAWVSLREARPVRAGVLIGLLAALKPSLLVWPALLLLSGRRKSAAWGLGTALLLSLLPALLYGPGIYVQWLQATTQASWLIFPHYLSLFSLAARLGRPEAGWPLALLLLAGFAVWAWRRRPPLLQASAVALALAMLAAPLATPRYTLLLVPAFFAYHAHQSLRLPAILLVIPSAVIGWLGAGGSGANFLAGLVYPLAVGLFLLACLQSGEAEPAPGQVS